MNVEKIRTIFKYTLIFAAAGALIFGILWGINILDDPTWTWTWSNQR